jgi:DNA-directed RNA polymerase subunit M/transcription elongation factor TFIIS
MSVLAVSSLLLSVNCTFAAERPLQFAGGSSFVFLCVNDGYKSQKPGKCPKCQAVLEKRSAKEAESYVCPHCPDVSSSEPIQCPKCGLELVPRRAAEKPLYVCPNCPGVNALRPGKCPFCNSKLEQKHPGQTSQNEAEAHSHQGKGGRAQAS